jgi:two-component system sensor histidine kinase ChvG
VRDKGLTVARALEPLLANADRIPHIQLGQELARFGTNDVQLRLLFQPSRSDAGFFYVASAPQVDPERLSGERDQLAREGVLDRLNDSCSGDVPLAMRVGPPERSGDLVTSITPVQTGRGCWALVVSNRLAGPLKKLGQQYWEATEVQIALGIYLAMAVIVFGLFFALWRNLRRFAGTARRIAEGDGDGVTSFDERNDIPELSPVAREFDQMVEKLRIAADNIRRAAEDNAHALKAPLATINQSLEALRRRIQPEDEHGQRALSAVDRCVERLLHLIQAARRLDDATANVLDPPRNPVDLSALCDDLIDRYEQNQSPGGARVVGSVADQVTVTGGLDMLSVAIENVIENALSFSPPGAEVSVTLATRGRWAILTVADRGPGVAPENLARIFERYFSKRPGRVGEPQANFGVGLWIVRRNAEALRGRVQARNRPGGGLEVSLELPLR